MHASHCMHADAVVGRRQAGRRQVYTAPSKGDAGGGVAICGFNHAIKRTNNKRRRLRLFQDYPGKYLRRSQAQPPSTRLNVLS